jgi:protoporphyrinogen oxidase
VPQPERGHRALLARVTEALARLPAFELAGAAYDGVSVEQALAAGERAAARLLARLRSTQAAGSGATRLEA